MSSRLRINWFIVSHILQVHAARQHRLYHTAGGLTVR
jgi:hypothetical protein